MGPINSCCLSYRSSSTDPFLFFSTPPVLRDGMVSPQYTRNPPPLFYVQQPEQDFAGWNFSSAPPPQDSLGLAGLASSPQFITPPLSQSPFPISPSVISVCVWPFEHLMHVFFKKAPVPSSRTYQGEYRATVEQFWSKGTMTAKV